MGLFNLFRAQRTPKDAPRSGTFSVVDVETTGLNPSAHRVLELAVVTTDPGGQVIDRWSTRIHPQGPVGATHIHGITDADVATAPTFAQVIEQLSRRLSGSAIVAHNAAFDRAFLEAEYARCGWQFPTAAPTLCTLQASLDHLPLLERRRLIDCCAAVNVPLDNAHSALADATAAAGLLRTYVNATPASTYRPLLEGAQRVPWPTTATISPTPWTPPRPSGHDTLPEQARRRIRAQSSRTPDLALVQLVQAFSLVDALDEGAPDGSLTYLEKVAEVLEDGHITHSEAADLSALAQALSLDSNARALAHRAFVLALAHAALDDGRVSRSERAELVAIAELLEVDSKIVPTLLEQAEAARMLRLSVGLKELPADWALGEPLRVGDKVVFTGCTEPERTHLEQRSRDLGVRVLSSVSRHVAVLVTDGSFKGGKAAKARELGTATVSPEQYRLMLDYLQPATS